MKIIKIEKKHWSDGLERSRTAYRLIGPIKGENEPFAVFRELKKGELPDLGATDTVLSPKAIVYPQSEVMFEYSVDRSDPECNLLKRC